LRRSGCMVMYMSTPDARHLLYDSEFIHKDQDQAAVGMKRLVPHKTHCSYPTLPVVILQKTSGCDAMFT
jgi:hypothetical protein